MKHSLTLLFLTLVVWFQTNEGHAAEAKPASVPAPKTLRIATKVVPPFVMQEDQGWSGLSIELWNRVAAEMGVEATFVKMELGPMLEAVSNGEVDAALAAITANAERESTMDFSHPYFRGGIGIAYKPGEKGSLVAFIRRLFTREFVFAIGFLACVIAIAGCLMWWFERRSNPGQFGGGLWKGLGNGFWWSAVTMTTVGYGDKAPVTPGGRLIGLIWMFASILIISSLTAGIATALTVERLGADLLRSRHVSSLNLGSLAGSTGERLALREGWNLRSYTSLDKAVASLESGQVDALIYDQPVLRYLQAIQYEGRLETSPDILQAEDYSIALPRGSTWRKPINVALLKVLESAEWKEVRNRYFTTEEE